jgi:ribosomal protein S18 acetylase RimI-like enzyme
MPIEVSEATPADLRALRDLERDVPGNESDPDTLPDALRSGRALLAREHGAIVGFVVFAPWFFGRRLISRLAVRREDRRRGIASLLLTDAKERAGDEDLFISANRSNVAAHSLYEKLGFEPSGIVENLDDGDPEVIYHWVRPSAS